MLEGIRDKLREGMEEIKKEIGGEPEEEIEEKIDAEEEEKEEVKERALSLTKKVLTEDVLEDVLWDLQVGLIEKDVAMETAEDITERIKDDLQGVEVGRGEVEERVREAFENSLRDVLGEEVDLIAEIEEMDKPCTLLFLGFNGSGKTTTIARFAKLLRDEGLTPVMAAGDTWRAAAIQQLEEHGEKLDVRVIKQEYESDSAAVIYDAVEYAEKNGIDVVLADTAGRSHTDVNLMDELEKITRVNDPDRKILVLDSLTGNDAVEQAREFEEGVEIDGVILTKMDVNEEGGAALSVSHAIGKPIYYLGVGQGYDDLEKYDPEEMLERLL